MAQKDAGRTHSGNESTTGGTSTIPDSSYRSDAHAVIIGINEYEDEAIHNLNYARADAKAVYEVLIDPKLGRFNPKNVQLLLDSDATGKGIKTAICTVIPGRANEQDTVYIYYAGHGAPVVIPGTKSSDGFEKYLAPTDAEADNLRATGIPMEDIQKYFSWIDSKQVIFFIDSCYSGGLGGRSFAPQSETETRAISFTDEYLDGFAGKGRCIVAACDVNELAIESSKLGHGLFTYYLVEGLKGAADTDKDGLVSIEELFIYISKHVKKEARKNKRRMNPVYKGEVYGSVYLTDYETDNQKRARILNKQAKIHYDADETGAAREKWKQVLDLVPDDAEAQQGLDDLEKTESKYQARVKAQLNGYFEEYKNGEITQEQYEGVRRLIEAS